MKVLTSKKLNLRKKNTFVWTGGVTNVTKLNVL